MTEFERIAAATGITDLDADAVLDVKLSLAKVDGLAVVAVVRSRRSARITSATFYSARTAEEAKALAAAEDVNV